MRYCEKDKILFKFSWRYCPECREELKDVTVCQKCGKPITDDKCSNCESGMLVLVNTK
jgi:predicted amidophosphoribosyltransferase